MAQLNIPPPAKMDMNGDVTQNWRYFQDSWNNYIIATDLKSSDAAVIVATLLSVIGKECYQVYMHLPMTEAERKDYKIILKKLSDYFEPKKNTIYERYVFNSTVQEPNDSFDAFVNRLRKNASSCNYGDLCDEMIRDRIVIGLQDNQQRARLLREADLTLERTLTLCRTSELTQQQLQKIEGESVHFAKSKYKSQQMKTQQIKNCKFCGDSHPRGKCPAYGTTCSKCNKDNHFPSVCRSDSYRKQSYSSSHSSGRRFNRGTGGKSAKIHAVGTEEEEQYDSEESIYMFSENNQKKYMANIIIKIPEADETRQITFQVDTGATCCTLTYDDYKRISNQKLEPSDTTLKLYDNSTIKPLGKVRLECFANKMKRKIHFQVVKEAPVSLLSGRASEALKLFETSDCVFHLQNQAEQESLTQEQILSQYSDIFTGLGKLPGVYKIEMDPDIKPVQHNPRRVPLPVKAELKKKIRGLEQAGIIQKVTEPTPWISSMVVVRKPNKLRICLDPMDLNKGIKRNHYPTPTIDDLSPNLANAKIFSVVDAKDGFLQVVLDSKSSFLTTFWTPFGRYRWLRMPFGIKSAPEEFQRRLDECLEGLENISVIADDILIYGTGDTPEEAEASHDKAISALFQRCRERGLKLNKKKIRYKLQNVAYMGHIFGAEGIKPDPEKTRAVLEMEKPSDVQGVQRLIGVVTYLAKFLPQLSTVSEPLRRLTDKDSEFDWLPQHEEALQQIKKLISVAPVLRYYDVNLPVTLESDSSDVGLGAVITQQGQPIAYASRALTKTERNYAQIEKECLSIVFAAERFEHYILGKENVKAYTDHKPLMTICKKPILTSPKRLQRMRLRLQKYSLDIEYKSGSTMHISDTLSRASLPIEDTEKKKADCLIFQLEEKSREFEEVDFEDSLFISNERLNTIREATHTDVTLTTLMGVIKSGWPDDKTHTPLCIREYWPYRDELATQNGIVFRGTRIIIPTSMRPEMIKRAHRSHLGIQYTQNTAREIMYWPRMTADLQGAVQNCQTCEQAKPAQQKETMMSHPIPKLPWQVLASDCFEINNTHYLVVVDLYSDYIDFCDLKDMSSNTLITALKPIFATHGTPNVIITDNGTNYASREFTKFATEWEFQHITTSPHHHKANGRAEAAVKIVKHMLQKVNSEGGDIYKSILEWRNTVTPGSTSSPAQRLMSRRTRSFMPCADSMLQPQVIKDVPHAIIKRRQMSKQHYDKGAKNLPKLIVGQPVNVKAHPQQPHSNWKAGHVVAIEPHRRYAVEVEGRTYRRNRVHIRDRADTSNNLDSPETVPVMTSPITETTDKTPSVQTAPTAQPSPQAEYRTKSGRVSKPPKYLEDFVKK